jgi:hypothetical protein
MLLNLAMDCSNFEAENHDMKKITFLTAVLAAGISAFAQVPNMDFETWTNNNETQTTYLAPQGWVTTDEFITAFYSDSVYAVHSVTQTASSHSGSYAVQMNCVTSNEGDTVNGAIYSSASLADFLTALFNGQALGYGYTQRPATFSGYYKATMLGTDAPMVGIALTKWNTVTNSRDTLVNVLQPLANASSWTAFNIPLTYAYAEYPDSVFLYAGIQVLNNIAYPGSSMTLDDLGLSGNVPIGVNEIPLVTAQAVVYPNPFSESATIEVSGMQLENATVELYDLAGQNVQTMENISGEKAIISREGLANGIYFYSIEQDGVRIASGKISVQ